MILTLNRKFKKNTYTIGKLYINGQYFCDTIEDKDRGLTSDMTTSQISKIKVKSVTAIPTGKYQITLNVISPKYKSNSFYINNANGARVPRLLNVKGFEGVLIHCGNTEKDSAGCVIVGKNTITGKVTESKDTFIKLYKQLDAVNKKKETITMEIL